MAANEKFTGIIEIAFAIIFTVVIIYSSAQIKQFEALGYLGAFLISLLSSATILIPVPSWAAVIALSRSLNLFYLSIAAGLGAGIGEITGYIAGNGTIKLIDKNQQILSTYKTWIAKYNLPAIAFLAFIPNPFFDIAGMAAGALGIKWWKFLLASIVGKTVRFLLLGYIGAYSLAYL